MPDAPSSKSILIFTQNSFRDPLFYGTVIVYLKAINADRKFSFHVISYEQPEFALSAEEQAREDADLALYNIYRHPLTWGAGSLVRKVRELSQGFFLARKLVKQYHCKAIFALANIAGAFSYIIAKLLRIQCIVFTYEPHSEFMRDCGVWKASGLKFKLLHYMERKMGMGANYIATGTTHMVARLKEWKSNAKVYRVPSCIDESVFQFDSAARQAIRTKFNLGERPVFLYAGKFGDLYYKEEIAFLCKAILDKQPDAFFVMLTPNPKPEIEAMFQRATVPEANVLIQRVALSEMPAWISVADFGIVAVPPLPSQKFRSPIKVGEYLACGLPYIVCQGISEDDTWAKENQVGVVLETFTPQAIHAHWNEIEQYLQEPRATLRTRCRETGIRYRSKSIAVNAFTEIFTEIYPNA